MALDGDLDGDQRHKSPTPSRRSHTVGDIVLYIKATPGPVNQSTYKSLHYQFRVGHITVGQIVNETCEAIVQEYMEELIPCPKTPEEWKAVSAKFSKRWNFHHTIGALDGKHVAMRCPNNGGSKWYNYKGFHSLVMLALVDADYRFLYIDVGASGCGSDGGIFDKTPMRQALEEQTLGLPDPETLPSGPRQTASDGDQSSTAPRP